MNYQYLNKSVLNKSDFIIKLFTIILINLHEFPIIKIRSRGETPLVNGLILQNSGFYIRDCVSIR